MPRLRPLRRAAWAPLDESRYEEARAAAFLELKRHPELDHDEAIWVAFTERVVLGMGGTPPVSMDVALELTSRWSTRELRLYEDVRPSSRLWRAGLNRLCPTPPATCSTSRAITHSGSTPGSGSFYHGKTKPHASIFTAVLDLLESNRRAAMVGDTFEEDMQVHSQSACAQCSSTGSA